MIAAVARVQDELRRSEAWPHLAFVVQLRALNVGASSAATPCASNGGRPRTPRLRQGLRNDRTACRGLHCGARYNGAPGVRSGECVGSRYQRSRQVGQAAKVHRNRGIDGRRSVRQVRSRVVLSPRRAATSTAFARVSAVKATRRRLWRKLALAQKMLRADDRNRFAFGFEREVQVWFRLPQLG